MVMRTKKGSLGGGSVESEKCKGYLLSHESRDDEPGTRGSDDDVTSTDVATNGDVCRRRSYLEVLMQ